MATEILNYKAPIGRVVIRDRIKAVASAAVAMLLFTLLAFMTAQYVSLANSLERGEFLTQDQIVNGGKRFIDYYWSLNSRSVESDQFTAARMFVDKSDYERRVDYLVKSDFIGRVKRASIISEIDWVNATYSIVEPTEDQSAGTLRVEYKGELIVNRQRSVPWHMILILTPVEFSEENPTGVGVVSYIDVAEAPIL